MGGAPPTSAAGWVSRKQPAHAPGAGVLVLLREASVSPSVKWVLGIRGTSGDPQVCAPMLAAMLKLCCLVDVLCVCVAVGGMRRASGSQVLLFIC